MRFLKYIWEVNPRDEWKFCGYEIEDLWEEVLTTLNYKSGTSESDRDGIDSHTHRNKKTLSYRKGDAMTHTEARNLKAGRFGSAGTTLLSQNRNSDSVRNRQPSDTGRIHSKIGGQHLS